MNKYCDFQFFELSGQFLEKHELKKVFEDSDKWLSFYKNKHSNWILFYPFSEYHGGGQPYIINIGKTEFTKWLHENPNFIDSIRENLN